MHPHKLYFIRIYNIRRKWFFVQTDQSPVDGDFSQLWIFAAEESIVQCRSLTPSPQLLSMLSHTRLSDVKLGKVCNYIVPTIVTRLLINILKYF